MKRLLLALLRGEIERRIAVAGRDRQQVRQQRNGLTEIIGPLGEHCLQLVEPLLGRILAPETRRPLELGDARIERAVLVMRRAEIAQPRVWLAAEPLHDGLSDARLADTGLARDQHDAAVATLCLLPASQQQINLLVAADQRRGCRAQRLEPALHRAWPQRRIGPHRLRRCP